MKQRRKPETKPNDKLKDLWPMRINKFLAKNGLTTRKGADDLITRKKVFINGKLAVLGDKVQETDNVEVKGVNSAKKFSYFAYNKPVGLLTHSPIPRLFPVGRLDKNSHGLLILTDDGRITDRLLNPDYVHDKEYIVKVMNPLRQSFKENIEGGLDIEGDQTRPCKVKIINTHVFKITLTEGKKHQIRRMVSALHNEVSDLQRTRVLNIALGNLPLNSYRQIEGDELELFLKTLRLI
jgi:23S rRNA pseudouridine2604 synthase